MGHLLKPLQQLFRHLPVVLPLTDKAVDDSPPLLSPPHDALPLIAQQGQFLAEVVAVVGARMRARLLVTTPKMKPYARIEGVYLSSIGPWSNMWWPSLMMEYRICCLLNISAWNN